jgi:hypothetical protein
MRVTVHLPLFSLNVMKSVPIYKFIHVGDETLCEPRSTPASSGLAS